MTEVDTPLEIILDEGQIQALKNGETIECVLSEDGDRTDKLTIEWHTVIESEGAARLHDELTEIFEND